MKAWEYDAVVYDGEAYCLGCLPFGVRANSEGVAPILAGSEWDYYPSCYSCGAVHAYVSLTGEGERHEMEAVGPQPEDITISPTGPLGGLHLVAVVQGDRIGVYHTDEGADAAVVAWCDEHQFWPNVWTVSDHGNASLRCPVVRSIWE